MKDAELFRLKDLIEEVKKLDEIISLHKDTDDADFMISQYEAAKTKLISELIDELVSPKIQSPQSFSLIQHIIKKFYPAVDTTIYADPAIQQLAASI